MPLEKRSIFNTKKIKKKTISQRENVVGFGVFGSFLLSKFLKLRKSRARQSERRATTSTASRWTHRGHCGRKGCFVCERRAKRFNYWIHSHTHVTCRVDERSGRCRRLKEFLNLKKPLNIFIKTLIYLQCKSTMHSYFGLECMFGRIKWPKLIWRHSPDSTRIQRHLWSNSSRPRCRLGHSTNLPESNRMWTMRTRLSSHDRLFALVLDKCPPRVARVCTLFLWMSTIERSMTRMSIRNQL
jgi:hypothetical protein